MRIKLKNTPEQVELVKALGSKNKLVSLEAQEALAAFIAPVAREVLEKAGTANLIYTPESYNEDDQPSVPLDLYYNEGVDYVQVWQQNIAGGLPTSQTYGVDEMLVSTWRLDSAVSMLKKYARKARIDVVSKTISKMLQEVLVKQENNQWSIALKALAEASTDGNDHILAATTANVFQLDDLNRLFTLCRRINVAFDGGTPAGFSSRGLTDLFVSPEIMEEVRSFAYEPMNTRGIPNTDESTAVPLPDAVRQQIYNSAGASEIYGVMLHEVLEFGVAKAYNNLFDSFYGGSSPSFDTANDEILVGVDKGRESFIKLTAQNADSGDTFVAVPDDQFLSRSEKIGFYGSVEMGCVCVDSRAIVGISV